jgi:hypothetical protein
MFGAPFRADQESKMQQLDTPDELSDIQQERWARGTRTITTLVGAEVLNEAVMNACDDQDRWWELVVRRDDTKIEVDGPHEVSFDEAPANCWRLEVVLEAPVDFGLFVQLALRFPDATLFLPEIVLHQGECRPIQQQADLDLVTIFEI